MASFLSFLLGEKKKTASVAKERLQIILAHERTGNRNHQPDYLPQLQRDHAMAKGGEVNVRLRVVSDPVGRQLLESGHVPSAAVAADLSEHDDDRCIRAAGQLVERGIGQ